MDSACVFGSNKSLTGIISEPPGAARNPDMPGVLILNANVLHRVGPYGLHVSLARSLSGVGFPVLRFDLSGVGDSPSYPSDLSYDHRVVSEVQEAMGFLTSSQGAQTFILIGLCAGADNSYKTMITDSRVVGAVLLDGYGYRTVGYFLRYYLPRARRLDVWKRFFVRQLNGRTTKTSSEQIADDAMEDFYSGVRDFPPKAEFRASLESLQERGVKMLLVYTGGVEKYFNHEKQFREAFSTLDTTTAFQIEYFGEAMHTFPVVAHRRQLIQSIMTWAIREFGHSTGN